MIMGDCMTIQGYDGRQAKPAKGLRRTGVDTSRIGLTAVATPDGGEPVRRAGYLSDIGYSCT